MTYTVITALLDADGFGAWHDPRWPEIITEIRRSPPSGVQARLPTTVPITAAHGADQLGEIVHIEIDRHGALRAVGVVDDDPREHGLFCSLDSVCVTDGGITHRDIEVRGVGIVGATASLGVGEYVLLYGDVRTGMPHTDRTTWTHTELLGRAADTWRRRRRGAPFTVEHEPGPVEHRARISPGRPPDDDPPTNVGGDRTARTIEVLHRELNGGPMRAVLIDGSGQRGAPVGVRRLCDHRRGAATFEVVRTRDGDGALELAAERLLYGYIRTLDARRQLVVLSTAPPA